MECTARRTMTVIPFGSRKPTSEWTWLVPDEDHVVLLGDAGPGPPFLTVSPLALGDIHEIAPLGNLNPPSHVFPTDHIYFYPSAFIGSGTRQVPLVSPGDVVTTEITVNRRTSRALSVAEEYSLTFAACSDVLFTFAHVTSLAASFAAKVGSGARAIHPTRRVASPTSSAARLSASNSGQESRSAPPAGRCRVGLTLLPSTGGSLRGS